MCSSETFRPIVQPVAKATGADGISKRVFGKSVTDAVTPKAEPLRGIKPRKPYEGLAIGTQTGGTRKPLGSTSGLNT